MKKIMIIGASGFLGSRLAKSYSKGYDLYLPSHDDMDIRDKKSVFRQLNEYCPNIVINAAAISDVGRCEKEPELSYKINVLGAIHVAEACNKIGAKLVFCSSDQVYFTKNMTGAHSEDETLLPINQYGKQKLEAEKQCLKINPATIILRLSWMYDTIKLFDCEHGNFFQTLAFNIKTKTPLEYPIFDTRGITDVNEVVSNMIQLFDDDGGIYNFGSFNDKNTYETVTSALSLAGLNNITVLKNEKAFSDNPRNISMLPNKLNQKGIFFSTTGDALIRNLLKK